MAAWTIVVRAPVVSQEVRFAPGRQSGKNIPIASFAAGNTFASLVAQGGADWRGRDCADRSAMVGGKLWWTYPSPRRQPRHPEADAKPNVAGQNVNRKCRRLRLAAPRLPARCKPAADFAYSLGMCGGQF